MPVRDLPPAEESPAPALGESRARVLEVLRQAGEPLGVGEIARQVGLHANTTRFHLDALVEAELVDRTSEEREQPGRPRSLYLARPGTAQTGKRSYRLLADILVSYVAAELPEPARAALQAGQAWGRYLIDRLPPFRRIDADSATKQLVGALDGIGFAAEAVTKGGRRQILLRHCPFRETAEEHRDVVCAVHLGLMRGMLAGLDAPITVDRLEPFVEPRLCVAHLTARPAGQGRQRVRPEPKR